MKNTCCQLKKYAIRILKNSYGDIWLKCVTATVLEKIVGNADGEKSRVWNSDGREALIKMPASPNSKG